MPGVSEISCTIPHLPCLRECDLVRLFPVLHFLLCQFLRPIQGEPIMQVTRCDGHRGETPDCMAGVSQCSHDTDQIYVMLDVMAGYRRSCHRYLLHHHHHHRRRHVSFSSGSHGDVIPVNDIKQRYRLNRQRSNKLAVVTTLTASVGHCDNTDTHRMTNT